MSDKPWKNQNNQQNNRQGQPQQNNPTVNQPAPAQAQTTPVATAPAPVQAPALTEEQMHEQELAKAIKWLGQQITTIREWKSQRDQRMYATASHTGKAPNKYYNGPAELAEELLEAHRNENTFITYRLSYNGTSHIGRLIAVDKNRKLTFAIEPEYAAKAGAAQLEHFEKRSNASADEGETSQPAEAPEDAGFGSLYS